MDQTPDLANLDGKEMTVMPDYVIVASGQGWASVADHGDNAPGCFACGHRRFTLSQRQWYDAVRCVNCSELQEDDVTEAVMQAVDYPDGPLWIR